MSEQVYWCVRVSLDAPYLGEFGVLGVKNRQRWKTKRIAQKHCDMMNALKCRAHLPPCFVEYD